MVDQWKLRPYDPAADRAAVLRLWKSTLAPTWPVLANAVEVLKAGVVAEGDTGVVGFAAVDSAGHCDDEGSVPLLLVDPGHQRQKIGTHLLEAATRELAAAGIDKIGIGSGGERYIWPGVPLDLPGAVGFFDALGWRAELDTLDLTRDLRDYGTPAAIHERAQRAGVTFAVEQLNEEILAFESEHFARWARAFRESGATVLTARASEKELVGTLLIEGPDNLTFGAMLGPESGEIGCVGTAPRVHGQGIGTAMVARASEIARDRGTRVCFIGWTIREEFYGRLGYQPWRRYRMFQRRLSQS